MFKVIVIYYVVITKKQKDGLTIHLPNPKISATS